MLKTPITLVFLCWSILSCETVRAQASPPEHPADTPQPPHRLGFEIAGGPSFEVATAGDRSSQRAVLAVPALAVRVAPWFEYTLEGHLSRHVSPVNGNVFGIVPVAFRIHTTTRIQFHLSAGAGLAWTDLVGLHGVEQRRNFLTQIGTGVSGVGAGLSVEGRFFHLSNLHAAPPNLGMEGFVLLVRYRLPW